jgi:hypothetical protein
MHFSTTIRLLAIALVASAHPVTHASSALETRDHNFGAGICTLNLTLTEFLPRQTSTKGRLELHLFDHNKKPIIKGYWSNTQHTEWAEQAILGESKSIAVHDDLTFIYNIGLKKDGKDFELKFSDIDSLDAPFAQCYKRDMKWSGWERPVTGERYRNMECIFNC